MRQSYLKLSSIVLILFLFVSIFSGCVEKPQPTEGSSVVDSKESTTVPVESTEGSSVVDSKEPTTVPVESTEGVQTILPIVTEPLTLSFWVPFSSTFIQTLDENVVYQEMERLTGIKMAFIHPPAGQESEQYNLMIASGDYPDIIEYGGNLNYPGGPDQAIADGVFLRLNDLIEQHAPNFRRLRETYDDIRAQTISDEGNIWGFRMIDFVPGDPWAGTIIRNDWLDDLGLDIPITIDEWYTVLVAFRDEKGATSPLLITDQWWGMPISYAFIGAYDVIKGFYNQDGTIKFGPIEPGYKDFLITMNKWYSEKLIDQDFAVRDYASFNAVFTSGQAGAATQYYGDFGNMLLAGKLEDPDFTFAPVPSPTLERGRDVHFRQKDNIVRNDNSVITTACKYPVEAVKWIDYCFSEEGER